MTNKKDKKITVRFDEETYLKLQALSESFSIFDMSDSEMIRYCVNAVYKFEIENETRVKSCTDNKK